MVLLCLLIVVLYVRIVLELISSLAHDVLYPRCEFGIAIAYCHHEEDAGTEHIVEVVGHKRSDELVLLLSQSLSLGVDATVYDVHVRTVHNGAVVHVYEFCLLILQLVVAIEELEQLVVERSAADCLLSIVYFDSDVTLFEHERQYAFIIHENIGHTYRVERTIEMELTVYNVARIDSLEIVVM